MKARAFVEDGSFFFKLYELRHLYENRSKPFGIDKEVNKVKFKEQLVSHFPEAQVQSDGKNIILVFEKGMQQLLKQAYSCSYDHEDDALILAKAAKIIRRDILNYPDSFQFTGSFPQKCQEKSVPTNLKYLVSMILNGCNIKDQETTDSQNSLTISQAILYNFKRRPSQSTSTSHHSKKLIPYILL